jgi:hypothetical protein
VRDPHTRLITTNSMKGRNYIFFDSLGKLFNQFEEKYIADQTKDNQTFIEESEENNGPLALIRLQWIA